MEMDFIDTEEKKKELEEEQLSNEEIAKQQNVEDEIKNFRRNLKDTRKKSRENYSEQSLDEEVMNEIRNLENQEIQKRREAGKVFDPSKYVEDETTSNEKDIKEDFPSKEDEAENTYSGNVTANCELLGRDNGCNGVKVPSYRCKKGGEIHVNIKVNQKGRVTSAEIDKANSTSTDGCLINESIRYAKLSRFKQDFSAPISQEGKIIYNFVSQ